MYIQALGSCFPESRISNQSLLKSLGERLSKSIVDNLNNIGVRFRHTVVANFEDYVTNGDQEKTLSTDTTGMSASSVRDCGEGFHDALDQIGVWIFVTNSPNRLLPGLGYEVAAKMGSKINQYANILNLTASGCSGFPKAVEMAEAWLKSGMAKYVGVSVSESTTGMITPKNSSIYYGFEDFIKDRKLMKAHYQDTVDLVNTFLFGDGAITMILGNEPKATNGKLCSLFDCSHVTNLREDDTELLRLNFGGVLYSDSRSLSYELSPMVTLRGNVYSKSLIDQISEKNDLRPEWQFFVHTGSKHILDQNFKNIVYKSDFGRKISYDCLEQFGNLSSLSTPNQIRLALQDDTVNEISGSLLAFGVGFSASSVNIRITTQEG